MTDKKHNQTFFNRFALSGIGGLVGLATVAILAFSFGAMFFGGGEPVDDSHNQSQAAKSENPTIWTCSMHPQIRLLKPGKCPICSMDLIPLETGPGEEELGPRQLRMSETSKSLAQIQTTPAKRAFAETEIRMVGKITYDETKYSYITAWVPGRLDRLYADFTGITVKQGDHMVYMYSPELLAAQEELLQAMSAIEALSRSASNILKSTADATLESSRNKLRLFGLSADQIADIETNQTPTDHLTINAPIGGIVIHKSAQEGMYVKTGTRIYTIADLTKLWVMFEAYESDLPWLRYGQQVSFTSPSFPGETFNAIISFIDPVVNPRTRTVQVRAIVDNKNMKLKPDMFVSGLVRSSIDGEGRVISDDLGGKWIGPMHPEIVKDGPGKCDICGMPLVPAESLGYSAKALAKDDAPLLIPATAPLLTGTRAVVYVQIPNDEGPLFEGREVQLGPRAGDYYVVKSGIKEGEQVVTNGAFKIDSELQIQAKPSMMSPTGGARTAGHHHSQTNQPAKAEKPEQSQPPKKNADKVPANPQIRAALSSLYETYFTVQMALASDDLEKATQVYGELETAAGSVDMALFHGSAHQAWMSISEDIRKQAATGAAVDDIAGARDVFIGLAKAIINLNNTFGHSGGKNYYLTFCPMADSNKGVHWLQTVDTVYNSFFGKAMQRCGEIRDTLKADAGKED